jgi:dTDP-4-amino-4,6-dideoxygalactose transaminase
MDAILELGRLRGIPVVEDCAQSFGADWGGRKVGTLGAMGCFSFFPTKNLNAFGDAGMLVTDDDELAAQARMLRVHGSRKKYFNETVGYNSRLDELQAAMLRVKLPHIDRWNEGRRRVAARYRELLGDVPGLILPADGPGHVYHQYTIRLSDRDRDAFQADLAKAGIGTMVYYPVPVHHLKLYQESHARVRCPVAERISSQVLSLPIWPEMEESTLQVIAAAVRAALGIGA